MYIMDGFRPKLLITNLLCQVLIDALSCLFYIVPTYAGGLLQNVLCTEEGKFLTETSIKPVRCFSLSPLREG